MKKKLLVFIILLFSVVSVGGYYWNQENSRVEAKEDKKTEKIEEPFKVASVQFNPILNERDKNVEELLKIVEEAFQNGARLVVAPEMATTGYYYADRAGIEPFVDSIPGKTTKAFEKLTKKYDSYIAFGMAEVDEETDIYYNSAALVGPDGYIGKYRKTQMWETEMHWAAWGDLGVPVFDTELGKIAINVCMDSAYYETARLAGIQGAEILAFPTNSSAQAISALPARAQQNGMYVVSANRSNTENGFHMIGGSAIWSPEGEKLAEAAVVMTPEEDINEPTITYASIDPKKYDNENKEALESRRPELYKELLQQAAPWDYTKNTTSHKVTAAALQYEPLIGNKESNKEKIKDLIKGAKRKNPDLNMVVLPELSLTGPVDGLKKKAIKALAETADGESEEFIADLSRQFDISIVFGFIEQDGKALYNSAMLVSEDGSTAGHYQKTHLSEEDKKWASAGDELPVFETESLGKIGILIGEDAEYPEASGVMAVKRADIIAIPSAWNGQFGGKMEINKVVSANEYPEGAMVTWDAVAIGAQAYTIVSNFIGTEQNFLGGSSLYTLDPLYALDQPVVASDDTEQALVVEFETIQPEAWFNQELLILSRKPAYFKPLILE
ncbi:nitrilase [Bacillus salacetis]|uniref:Nitrilase n=1 Tax=Bacillus salacetis TaxID=2315464 RepID=A0A3A1RAV1_9BACI|nr:nitrilase-related carbon-nitrogen hydrolase [Bacillus salacetis]RIW38806.1 nitrilase [Bacillus salacetis]